MSEPIRVEPISAVEFHLALSAHADRLLGGPDALCDTLAEIFDGVAVQPAPGQPGTYRVRLAPAALPSGCQAVDAIQSALSLQLARQHPSPTTP